MNGAQALLRTMAGSGVNVCFANPGTSEMHFVAALDNVPDVRGVLCLFEGGDPAPPAAGRRPSPAAVERIGSAAAALRSGEPCVILLGGTALRRPGLEAASRLAVAGRARLLCETFPARHERGAGLPVVDRLAYLAEFAAVQLTGARHLILAGARSPVSSFAYPGRPSSPVPPGCEVHLLAEGIDDLAG